ncbi:MAG: DUF433 domain-containing protein [Cyanobacteria bacterium P01_E01_bin.42]
MQQTFTVEDIIAFIHWQASLTRDSDIMGGEAVFPNSRLSVRHVGGMLERGERSAVILEDYPYLSERDLMFAHLYVKVYSQLNEVFN